MIFFWLLVTGTWLDYDFPIILGMSSSQVTNSLTNHHFSPRAWWRKSTRNLGFSESIRVDEASSIAFGAMDGLLGVAGMMT